ncbi:MAG: glycosyltransferase family 4 protein [Candidatus Bathyarchaeota archaeon]|nr:MAG: glycosyltransferase family 4 protein [Candidatus Bathyarchaeota archaeon]
MQFVIVTFDFPPNIGGVETRITNYIINLQQYGHHVTIVHPSTKDNISIEKYLGAVVYHCPKSPVLAVQTFLRLTHKIPHKIDALFILTGACSLIGILFLIWGKVKRIRTGIFLYGLDILNARENPIRSSLLLLSLIISDKIGVNSKATSTLLPTHSLHKIHFLYPGATLPDHTQYSVNQSTNDKKILYVGRLIKRKGVDDLLYAFKELNLILPEAILTIVGSGPMMNFLQSLTCKLGLNGKVEFTGTLTGPSLYDQYRECDVFTLPSKQINNDVEGFGMVFLEAALFKKPGVGTRSGGIPEAVIDRKTGILVPEGDIHALKEALYLLLTDSTLSTKLGTNAYNRVISRFSWNTATTRLFKMFCDQSITQ